MHVATSTIDRLIDYCFHTPADGFRSAASVKIICKSVEANKLILSEQFHFLGIQAQSAKLPVILLKTGSFAFSSFI